ncbi:glycine--tRNA ligase subunit beta [Hyphobacterium marinum]|uniref:Glycine--tRNA ligase beta subunit n=1 Tax=Hyphobacterium marinum TaxID=3116574 RepID=A0ABU7M1R1_9PROT|nr:glycine--tRNA ligase subunit beta [Hyphobacterium sp. Y6023]MEE2567467.1 glycine--tRNA ligase subunit beta [Hyphobacterium sp. Y6023]
MAQLLLEFLSEEIPARMQVRAEGDLERLLSAALKDAGLSWETLTTFSGPRRLGLVIEGLPEKTEDVREERKGPRTAAPEKALQGFMRGAGIDSLDACETREDKKGEFYVAIIEKPGRKTADVIAEAVPALARDFPWPKSMKFGEGATAQRWVRPLQRVVCLFDGAVVPFDVFGIAAGNETEGHRVLGRGPFAVKDFTSYEKTLREQGGVLTNRAEREAIILEGARKVCADAGLELIEDAGLLAEVTGLVEHPVPLLGQMDESFLDLPGEVIQLTMKTHQKYFAVRDPKAGALAPNFVVVANQPAPDGGKAIAAGNARVLSARLSDARHFWDNDRKKPLSDMAAELSKVTFHEKLGSVADKVERVAALARELAPAVGADPDLAERAARLAKADLVSEMVYEFPELQGVMGRYYALEQWRNPPSHPTQTLPSRGGSDDGDSPSPSGEGRGGGQSTGEDLSGLTEDEARQIADAIRDHYRPQGPSDDVPTAPVSAAVALADKLDTLVGFWAIDEKPTGSKDPFALRRAALGVFRILNVGAGRLEFRKALHANYLAQAEQSDERHDAWTDLTSGKAAELFFQRTTDLLNFFSERVKVVLKDEGVRFDVIDAVFAPMNDGSRDDDLVRVTNRARALQAFLETEDGAALLAGYRRAANILKAEEKKDAGAFAADIGEGALEGTYLDSTREPQEIALADALSVAGAQTEAKVADEDFEGAMAALSTLRAPVDAFFDAVTVNSDDAMLRRNRLRLLAAIRMAAHAVADFGKIEG